ncbi:MAG: hypothetical protein J6P83_04170 [Bacteroidales bacterium]|nr:hypothetical protein [Bacteroidales bacterium]
MKTNINTDNYEAYLLDYMEGNLGPDEAEQLKAFVAAQGLDWNELTEELPHLEAPAVAHPDKESLKKKGTLVPLYVKIASAAAAAGLLLTVTLWPEKSLPKLEPVAELKPILPERLITSEKIEALPSRTIQFIPNQTVAKAKPVVQERVEMPLLAKLEPIKVQALSNDKEPDFELLAYRMPTDFAFAQFDESRFEDEYEEHDLSLIGKGIALLTNGRHSSFGSLISSGISTAKKEISLAATDMALTAYYHADERFEEARERWEEKKNE